MPKNLYTDLNEFKEHFAGASDLDAVDAANIELIIEAGARRVDQATLRQFFAETGTRVLDGYCQSSIPIPDLLAATSIKLDEDSDRTFEIELAAATDYYLLRNGHENPDATPSTMLQLDSTNGKRGTFSRLPRLVEIVGRWGYTEDTEVTGAIVEDDPYLADATTLNVAAGQGALFAVGQTIKIEDEQFYISAIATDALTVTPAVNGTTAVDHVKTTAISRFIWEPRVREANLIIAGRMWKRRETGYANVLANLVVGQVETFRPLDPDVTMLLTPLVRGDYLV